MDAKERELFTDIRFPPGAGIAGWVATNDEALNLRDALKHEHFDNEVDVRGGIVSPHSILCVPIRTRDNCLKGVLQARRRIPPLNPRANRRHHHRERADVRGYEEDAEESRGSARNYPILGSTLELHHHVNMIMDAAKELLTADRCTLFLRDSDGKQLRAQIQGRDGLQEIRIPLNAGVAASTRFSVFNESDPLLASVNIRDVYKESRLVTGLRSFNPKVDKQTGYVTRNILYMPVKNGGPYLPDDERILGSFLLKVNIYWKGSAKGVEVVAGSGGAPAVAIEKSQLFTKTEGMRMYLQSNLSSITSCVVTLSDNMRLNTMNRPWFMNALGVTQEVMMEQPVDKWIGEQNYHLLNDIVQVYEQGTSIYPAEYELKGPKNSTFVSYQIMPLIGDNKGVVMVLDDISSENRAVMTLGSDAVNAILSEQGDAVMAVFGVPFVSPDDSIHACNAALRMKDSLAITNKDRQAAGKKPIKIGIGVNTGIVLSGNIGSIKRMEFSCIGDAVNLASRTEGLTKGYGITILVTENTLRETGDAFLTRHIDSVVVTGKTTKVELFELMGRKDDVLPREITEAVQLFAQASELYRSQKFEIAAKLFRKAVEVADDGPSKTFFERCIKFQKHPPPPDWSGSFANLWALAARPLLAFHLLPLFDHEKVSQEPRDVSTAQRIPSPGMNSRASGAKHKAAGLSRSTANLSKSKPDISRVNISIEQGIHVSDDLGKSRSSRIDGSAKNVWGRADEAPIRSRARAVDSLPQIVWTNEFISETELMEDRKANELPRTEPAQIGGRDWGHFPTLERAERI
ncbi:hypothetical protein BDK51DRAFT_40951 [Blyttiomyces helicus]|uniref:Guanylate cyclase domain-containing protein n=1 Tax=Blyttiomyces helicus TaxID=388810 RepID=A0A4P9WIB0_9FUNG|nr:hypothetical protein BDK51DRAFT_40951 [Blyttiomyces helicus]|eukprot:RKO92152.1 hypothetical protein BDK51DRAFT_40951 [Blyttiomyces helicus]